MLVTSADEVCAICEVSAVRIGARREGELGREGERIGRMATRVARRVGGEACETKVRERVGLGGRVEGRHVVVVGQCNQYCTAHRDGARAYAVLTAPSLSDSPPFDSSNPYPARPLSPSHSLSHRLSLAFAIPCSYFSSVPCSFYYFLPLHPLFLFRHSFQVNILSFALLQRGLHSLQSWTPLGMSNVPP